MAEPTWSNVHLLLHCNGSDGDKGPFTDSSSYANTISGDGTYAQLDTAQKKFGTASLLFDTISAVTDPVALDDPLPATAWTVETFFRTNGGEGTIAWGHAENLSCRVGDDYKLAIGWTDDDEYPNWLYGTTVLAADTQYHLAISFDGTTLRGFIDGAVECSTATTFKSRVDTSPNWQIEGFLSGDGQFWLDEYRLVLGEAVYTSAFTAPSAEFSEGAPLISGVGALASQGASVAGAGTSFGEKTGFGALNSENSTIRAYGCVNGICVVGGTGTLAAQSAAVDGTGRIAFQPSLPISMGVLIPVTVGLPIRIDIYTAVTPSLPITIGPYPVTPTLPIVFKTPVAVSLPSVTITFPGSYAAVLTAAGTDVITWTPKCILNGVDISGKLIGAQDIEFEETAAPVATFSFIPAAGSIDPLMYVGKAVSLSITIGTATYLAFTGIVSDPEWDADNRTITISATGDLQSRLDAMTKAEILAQLGGTFSEYIFDDPANMSGWEYGEALISTQPKVIWQDANGLIRTTSILAKGSADYTFTASDILDTAQVVRWQGRLDFINKLTVSLGYRFQRRRQRNKKFSFHPYQLSTPSMFLSGNEGGWELPQRSQIESAANGGGWTVIGDIKFNSLGIPPWEYKAHPTYSDQGIEMMSGLVYGPDDGNLCVGADWTAAKRWLQTVTEQYTLVVTASDSIEAVGTLATEESYAIEDETTDEAWESSLDYDGYVTGAIVMANGVDYKADLDGIRTDVTTAMEVALAKAQNEVLKSHRGTTVAFTTTYDPRVDLSHTVAVDTRYLDCKGKVRRIAHHWDIDTGDATTEIEVALSRHNGTGLATSDTLTPPSEPADPAETAPDTYRKLLMHIGGQDDRPVWDETWDGYVVNVSMVGLDKFGGAAYPSTSTTSLASQYYLSNTWQRDPSNPALIGKIYEPGFHILPDAIDATYADPSEVTAAQTYDVEIPEDTITLISG